MDNEIKTLQNRLLIMMKWFHAFCAEHDLRYYAINGTMLGAFRHHGFIPWDDDLDVGMPRKDYEKLRKLLEGKTNSEYILETPHSEAKDFNYTFTKLYDPNTTLIENLKYKVERGIYLDIFPLDGMGNTEKEAKMNFRVIDRKFKFILAHTTSIRKGRTFLKNLAVFISQRLLDIFINDKKAILKLDLLSGQIDYDSSKYCGSSFGAWRWKEVMQTSIIGKPVLYDFEDTKIYGVENAADYLQHVYGNWQELPPPEKQISHHDYVKIDLNRPYTKASIVSK